MAEKQSTDPIANAAKQAVKNIKSAGGEAEIRTDGNGSELVWTQGMTSKVQEAIKEALEPLKELGINTDRAGCTRSIPGTCNIAITSKGTGNQR